MPAPGAAPEGGKSRIARPGCRGALLFGYFLLGKQEKVTRRKGEKGRLVQLIGLENKILLLPQSVERSNLFSVQLQCALNNAMPNIVVSVIFDICVNYIAFWHACCSAKMLNFSRYLYRNFLCLY